MPDLNRQPRSDAQRNKQLVLDAGIEFLTREPTMSMQEIAEASGLGRTTVYRHFSNREELLDAVFEAVGDDARATTAAVLEEQGDAEQSLRSISDAIFALNLRYGALISMREVGDGAAAASTDGRSPVGTFFREARDRGEIRADLPLHWQLLVLQHLSMEAVEGVNDGALKQAEAKGMLADTLVSILMQD
jgi:AcrR family transcriptional regulator